MSDFPLVNSGDIVTPLFVNTFSRYAGAWDCRTNGGTATTSSLNWTSNLCVYVPMSLPFDYEVKRVFWHNGSAGSANAAFAIYTPEGDQIYTTGSVAQSGAWLQQYVTPASSFILPAGHYFFAASNSGTSNQMFGTTTWDTEILRFAGVMQQSTAHPPPSPATPAAATAALYPICGVTRTESGF